MLCMSSPSEAVSPLARSRCRPGLLPHWLPNAGVRQVAGGRVLAYTGDTRPSHHAVDLRRGADLLLAAASYADQVPEDPRRYLSPAAEAGGPRPVPFPPL